MGWTLVLAACLVSFLCLELTLRLGLCPFSVLRPVAFMENFVPGMMGKVFGAIWWHTLKNDKKLQVISTKDIGLIAAIALQDPKKYNHQFLDLAGDELSFKEVDQAFKAAAGIPAPQTFTIFGWAAKKAVKEMDLMVRSPLPLPCLLNVLIRRADLHLSPVQLFCQRRLRFRHRQDPSNPPQFAHPRVMDQGGERLREEVESPPPP